MSVQGRKDELVGLAATWDASVIISSIIVVLQLLLLVRIALLIVETFLDEIYHCLGEKIRTGCDSTEAYSYK